MADPKININVQQGSSIESVRQILQQEVTVNRLALNLKQRKDRLRQELGG